MRIYVINLDRRTDRKARIDEIFSKCGLDYQRVSAIDAKSEEFFEISKDLSCDGPTGRTSNNTRACTLSHFKAWQEFVNDPDAGSIALILEDDVIISSDFVAVIKDISKNSMYDFGLIKIEQGGAMKKGAFLGPKLDLSNGFGIRKSYQHLTDAAAYIITRETAERLLTFRHSIKAPIDHFLFYPIRRSGFWGGPYGVLDPAIVIQDRSIQSDIRSQPYLDSRRRRDFLRLLYESREVPSIVLNLLLRKCRLVSVNFRP